MLVLLELGMWIIAATVMALCLAYAIDEYKIYKQEKEQNHE